MPSQETPVATSTSGPEVELKSVRKYQLLVQWNERFHVLTDRWESDQPAGVWSARGRNFLSLRSERRHVGLWRRERPQGGSVGLRLQKTERDGGESIDLWVSDPREEHLDIVWHLDFCV